MKNTTNTVITTILFSLVILFTGCDREYICFDIYGNPEDCTEQNLTTVSTSTEAEAQSRQVNCSNAGFGYSIGQPLTGIRTIQIDSVYCDSTSTARVAASFFAGAMNTTWYDAEWTYLDTLVQAQTVDYPLPIDSLGNSVYYVLGLYADPNATHPQGNPNTVQSSRSFY